MCACSSPRKPPTAKWPRKILLPNQDDRGIHVNVGGAGVVEGAPNRENAIRFLEFLASDEAQEIFAAGNYEFPVVEGVTMNETLESWGEFKKDDLNVSILGEPGSDPHLRSRQLALSLTRHERTPAAMAAGVLIYAYPARLV